jgi:hypothetical protein
MKDHFFPIEKYMLIFHEARRAGISAARGEAPGNDTRSPLPALPAMNSDAGRVGWGVLIFPQGFTLGYR